MEIIDSFKNDLVSIIIPFYNSKNYLSNSILSALHQSYKNIEIILIDDGSTDGSLEVAEAISQHNNSIRVFSQPNKGQGIARNKGLELSRGKWIYFLDSDDTISINAIETMLKSAKEYESDFVFSCFQMTERQIVGNIAEIFAPSQKNNCDELCIDFLLRKTVLIAPGTLINKTFLSKNKILFENIPWSEDQHFLWKLLMHANNVSHVNGILYHYLFRKNSIMTGTKYKKIVDSYPYFERLGKEFNSKPVVSKFLASRWVIGSLNSSALNESYKNWKELYYCLEAKKHSFILREFPDKRIRISSFCLRAFPYLYYRIIKSKKMRKK